MKWFVLTDRQFKSLSEFEQQSYTDWLLKQHISITESEYPILSRQAYARRRSREIECETNPELCSEVTDRDVASGHIRECLAIAWSYLTRKQQQAILAYWQHGSFEAAATELGTTRSVIWQRVRRGATRIERTIRREKLSGWFLCYLEDIRRDGSQLFTVDEM